MTDDEFAVDLESVTRKAAEVFERLSRAAWYDAESAVFAENRRAAKAVADMEALTTREARRQLKARKLTDGHNRVFRFNGGVSDQSVKTCMDTLAHWHRKDATADWSIIMNSPGGSLFAGMALLDDIVAYSLRGGGTHKITITVRGMAASMGGIILQAADVRVCGPESYILIHEISTGAGGKVSEIEDEVAFVKHVGDRVARLFEERSGGKLTKSTLMRKWKKTDWWLDSDEALKIGVVDEIG